MHPVEEHYLDLTRRRFFGQLSRGMCGAMGTLALSSLLRDDSAFTGDATKPAGATVVHFRPRAKRIIYMHM